MLSCSSFQPQNRQPFFLSEEEKRTLITEGLPIPAGYPLTKVKHFSYDGKQLLLTFQTCPSLISSFLIVLFSCAFQLSFLIAPSLFLLNIRVLFLFNIYSHFSPTCFWNIDLS